MDKGTSIWLYGLLAAVIGGGAAAVTATVTASLIAPDKFNLGSQLGNFFVLAATTFIVSGFLKAMAYLSQSPIPKQWDGDERRNDADTKADSAAAGH